MKKLIPLIAVALAMAMPATMAAETLDWDFESGCPPLDIIKANILDNDITFTSSTYRSAMLTAINAIYDYVDNEQYSNATSAADALDGYCDTYIEDEVVAGNVAVVLGAIADVYEWDPDDFWCTTTSSADAGVIDDGTEDGCLLTIEWGWETVHKDEACEEKYRRKWDGCILRPSRTGHGGCVPYESKAFKGHAVEVESRI